MEALEVNFSQVAEWNGDIGSELTPDVQTQDGLILPLTLSTDPTESVPVEEAVEAVKQLYFVRIPRPNVDETKIKRLQEQLRASVDTIKSFNGKLSAKRSVVSQLRKEMADARMLRDAAQPIFEEKFQRLQALKSDRNERTTKIGDHRSTFRDLDVKSEEELDAKLKAYEDKIQHGEVGSLREEKLLVQQIAKLKSQRMKVKEYGTQKSSLTELEGEVVRIKNVISELKSEFNIVKSEKDAAYAILKDLYTKLQAADKAVKEVEEEQGEAVRHKNEIASQLEQARQEADESMAEYRQNRTFSREVRELVEANRIEEASRLCAEQTDALLQKLSSDNSYRKEYTALWASQRNYVVSALLPQSSTSAPVFQEKGKPAPRGAAAPPKPLVARGAEKAKAVIEAALQEASREFGLKRSAEVIESPEPAIEVEVKPPPLPKAAPAPRPTPTLPPKPVLKADVPAVPPPVIEDFEVPNYKAEAVSAEEAKQKLREEQRLKQADAELRKKKKQEVEEKKKVKALEVKKAEATAAVKAPKTPVVVAAAPPPEEVPQEVPEAPVVAPTPAPAAAVKPLVVPAALKPPAKARRPKENEKIWKRVVKFVKQNQVYLAAAGVVILLLLLAWAALVM